MGEAKRRGSREDRVQQSLDRREQERRREQASARMLFGLAGLIGGRFL